MIGAAPQRHRVLALAWLLFVAVLGMHQWYLWRAPNFVTDVSELLPHQSDAVLEEATARLLSAAATQWVVLVGSDDWSVAQRAARTVLETIDPARHKLQSTADGSMPEALLLRVRAARGALIAGASREWLKRAPDAEIADRALQNLVQPVGDGLSSWREDPLGLLGEWVRERAQGSRLRPRDGWLWLEDAGTQWIALPFAESASGLTAWNAGTNSRLLASARKSVADKGYDARILAAGTSLLAEAAAKRASLEISIIGTGSLIAVILLTWATFGSLRPILLVTLSLTIGCAAALSITELIFGRVHLLTTVFGASLIGVAEDYGIHYFAARQGTELDRRWEQMRHISPGLWLALATSGIAYLALGLAPLPGLRQIAVFSCVGLTAAFLTVLCWFPWLDRKPLPVTRFAEVFARSLDRWPRWSRNWKWPVSAVAILALLLTGLLRLQSVDDVRQLQNAPPQLLAEQLAVGRILGLTSPAQMFLASGKSQESLLRNEEALAARLDTLVRNARIIGYQATSEWVPSEARQSENSGLAMKAQRIAWRAMLAATGEKIDMEPVAPQPLDYSAFDSAGGGRLPVSMWQDGKGDYHSLILLRGVVRDSVEGLARAAEGLEGIRWVDNTQRYSTVLSTYRIRLSALLVVGTLGVMLLLHWRYGPRAWRAYLPTLLGGIVTLAVFGWLNTPVQIFVVLSLILLLGMGIDYGIFMLEHPGERSVWLAVAIAGISTLLAFGLLALSTTPALRAFGLGILVGETSTWLLTPLFRPNPPAQAGQ